MSSQLINGKHLLKKSLLLSVLIHGLMFNTFIFVWPVIPEPHKPILIFLGSILRSSDIVVSAAPQQEGIERSLDNLSFIKRESRLIDSSPRKPHHEREYLPENKRTIKPIQAQEKAASQDVELRPKGEVDLDFSVEPYKPLRLRAHDQN